jgi:hypothetical protein
VVNQLLILDSEVLVVLNHAFAQVHIVLHLITPVNHRETVDELAVAPGARNFTDKVLEFLRGLDRSRRQGQL